MAEQYVPILVSFALGAIVISVLLTLGRILGPKTKSAIKEQAFECGNPPTGSAWGRFSVKFYMVAILFIIFDVEVVFMYPWAVRFRALGWPGFFEMLMFAAILALGLAYVWRKGALEWD